MPPTSTIGFGREVVSSLNLVPKPPAKITAFMCLVSKGFRVSRMNYRGISIVCERKLNLSIELALHWYFLREM